MNKLLISLSLLIFLGSCGSWYKSGQGTKQYSEKNGNELEAVRLKRASKGDDSAIVTGKISIKGPYSDSFMTRITVNDKHYQGDSTGRFTFKLAEGKYNFTGAAFMYNALSVKKITLLKGDSLVLNFKLTPTTELLE
ncbi:carboxypeptidase regulatory-like domain-containing protein [Chitinophaga polysaccharea]|uniref:carboxypeptidase regulatory-like domain-containing protein n=1 Tax=Chitinophaga polysaccharea TaxID=1293035 RepID=UPI0011591F50|nr:carboxypeptidase regulatory-like domain-containing protein [Chitinophaga polysaccharea]